ncbi:MAG: HD domain-containing protein [Bacteroidales bacterium]|nr:HD domain-containing protein [Bacteroidales bacterium]
MNLTENIESAELMFRQILEDFFVSVYDEKVLPSHGIDHHRRVWSYARELLYIPLKQHNSKPACLPSKLIIACYLHDSGMSVETGPRHGKHSREFCIRFLENNNLSAEEYKDVLDTVENHDRKDYPSESDRNDLLTVLSVADDLDAFGFTGIYRYSEIYLTRNIGPDKLGDLIIANAARRFENFESIFGTGNNYVQLHRKRFEILINFFRHYNRQVTSYDFGTDEPEGYCGIVQLFMLMLKNNLTLNELFTELEIYPDDIIIGSFVMGLKTELLLNKKNE